MSLLLLLLLLPLLLLLLHRLYRRLTPRAGKIPGSRVGLVIAHPDDEAMFFGPVVLQLAAAGCELHVLCLSTGNAFGLGQVRHKELLASCAVLSIPPERVTVVDDPEQLPDDIRCSWPTRVICGHLRAFLERHRLDSLVTFDEHGVSGHPNHGSCYRAVRELLLTAAAAAAAGAPPESMPACYALRSRSLLRKYLGPLDVLVTLLCGASLADSPLQLQQQQQLFVNSPEDCVRVRAALGEHRSQLVWYRRIFIIISRYAYANELVRIIARPP